MRWLRRKDRERKESRPTRLLGWAIVLGLLFALVRAGEYPEDRLRAVRNHLNERPASGEIVMVGIDEKSLREVGRWPWPRGRYADLVDAIDAARPKQQVHDIMFPDRSDPAQDRLLAASFARSSNVTLAYLPRAGAQQGVYEDVQPLPEFREHTGVGAIALQYNYANEGWMLPLGTERGNSVIPSLATVLAQRYSGRSEEFRVNYAFDPASIKTFSAADVIAGRHREALRGKTVVVGLAAERLGDQFMLPGWGKMSGVYIHIIGAETLKAGKPIDLGWIPAFLLATALVCLTIKRSGRQQIVALVSGMAALLLLPALLERSQIFADVTPGLFVVSWVGIGLLLRNAKRRGLTNAISGLPNLNALRRASTERDRPLIVARVVNYAQIVSTLTQANERNLVEQVAARLKVGSEVATVYQGDEGIFAWTVPPGTAIGHHVEALAALFRSPAKIDGRPLDIAITFGVEIGSGRSLSNRLNSALVAADEATNEGLRWKYHDPERLKDADWRLSLLSQLDDAIDNGQVWVAYQPQLDLRSHRIRGAEALARWTHPEKGPISPVEFVAAAEQNDRIEKLTMFVLDKAVEAAARINKEHGPFDMAVNLSARMLGDKSLPSRVRAVLDKHGLDPARLTLELTETAALANGADTSPLFGLKDLGVRVSIDDYGTGLSTLDYLKKVPASEIKIDQSFVKSMREHRSDLVMVQSTIALAHSLGRTVVAEGVENREILDMLIAMKCEVAQGFIVGRPSSLNDLAKRLNGERKKRAA
ncbi:EAL domain-containing protein [Sphingomonas sp. NSE70-1]|uniref:EAL domain-containing protein n=1 Tax=Sphingomonas caseinilyticus TaxID=2908205 RepID=A0ABT0RQQ3_9SPHN|nr:EAL domain-containing protein [Sphingomonas caseinilyticus]MCL6697347.1 EAL domain-containing protein [Sphingomonas caseinilyticus]